MVIAEVPVFLGKGVIMHEVSVIQSLLEQVERCGQEHCLARVTKVVVRIGDRVGICKDSLRFAFEAVSPGTIAEGAEFVIESVPGKVRCASCGFEAAAGQGHVYECSRCGGSVRIIAGQELDLQTIEGDQEETDDEN